MSMAIDGPFKPLAELQAGLAEIVRAPRDGGTLEMIAARPAPGERRILERATLDVAVGLIGDNWAERNRPDLEAQITLIGARVIALLAGSRERWPLAGDQLYVDFDLSKASVPSGTRLAIGSAVIQISAEPHTGCSKFKARFGADALRFVSTKQALELQLRGVNARVLRAGDIAVGDTITRL